jgi:hypothetical protein
MEGSNCDDGQDLANRRAIALASAVGTDSIPSTSNGSHEQPRHGVSGSRRLLGPPQSCIEDGPEVDDPAEEKEPEDAGENELNHSDEQSPLQELSQAGNEKAGEGSDDVPCGSLTSHLLSHGVFPFTTATTPRRFHGRRYESLPFQQGRQESNLQPPDPQKKLIRTSRPIPTT